MLAWKAATILTVSASLFGEIGHQHLFTGAFGRVGGTEYCIPAALGE